MDKTFYTWSNLDECTVVSHNDNLTLNLVTNLEVSVKSIPWMWGELLQAESNALLLLIEVEDNDVKLLIQLNNLLRIAYAAP